MNNHSNNPVLNNCTFSGNLSNGGAEDDGGSSSPYDQRETGFPRIVGVSIDMGAFEYQGGPPWIVTPIADVTVDEDDPNTVINLLTSFDDEWIWKKVSHKIPQGQVGKSRVMKILASALSCPVQGQERGDGQGGQIRPLSWAIRM